MDRAGRQAKCLAVFLQSAGRRLDREGGDVMLSADNAGTGHGVAACDVEIMPRGVRPGILHTGRQGHAFARGQSHAVDIDLVACQIGADIRIDRDLARGRRLRPRQPGRGKGGGGYRYEGSAADHHFLPICCLASHNCVGCPLANEIAHPSRPIY